MLVNVNIPVETIFLLGLAVLVVQMFQRQSHLMAGRQGVPTADYIYKIARITGLSEYESFRKAAERWPVSRRIIDRDFKDYLIHQQIPHYVNDFIRKNRRYIDELKLPPV